MNQLDDKTPELMEAALRAADEGRFEKANYFMLIAVTYELRMLRAEMNAAFTEEVDSAAHIPSSVRRDDN